MPQSQPPVWITFICDPEGKTYPPFLHTSNIQTTVLMTFKCLGAQYILSVYNIHTTTLKVTYQ